MTNTHQRKSLCSPALDQLPKAALPQLQSKNRRRGSLSSRSGSWGTGHLLGTSMSEHLHLIQHFTLEMPCAVKSGQQAVLAWRLTWNKNVKWRYWWSFAMVSIKCFGTSCSEVSLEGNGWRGGFDRVFFSPLMLLFLAPTQVQSDPWFLERINMGFEMSKPIWDPFPKNEKLLIETWLSAKFQGKPADCKKIRISARTLLQKLWSF